MFFFRFIVCNRDEVIMHCLKFGYLSGNLRFILSIDISIIAIMEEFVITLSCNIVPSLLKVRHC